MNSATRESLQRFIDTILILAAVTADKRVAHRVMDAAEDLKQALDKDETII